MFITALVIIYVISHIYVFQKDMFNLSLIEYVSNQILENIVQSIRMFCDNKQDGNVNKIRYPRISWNLRKTVSDIWQIL